MNMYYLYLISQTINNDWETYDSAIVCTESEESARLTHPSGDSWDGDQGEGCGGSSWAKAIDVKVQLLGVADDSVKEGVVLASFNAG